MTQSVKHLVLKNEHLNSAPSTHAKRKKSQGQWCVPAIKLQWNEDRKIPWACWPSGSVRDPASKNRMGSN